MAEVLNKTSSKTSAETSKRTCKTSAPSSNSSQASKLSEDIFKLEELVLLEALQRQENFDATLLGELHSSAAKFADSENPSNSTSRNSSKIYSSKHSTKCTTSRNSLNYAGRSVTQRQRGKSFAGETFVAFGAPHKRSQDKKLQSILKQLEVTATLQEGNIIIQKKTQKNQKDPIFSPFFEKIGFVFAVLNFLVLPFLTFVPSLQWLLFYVYSLNFVILIPVRFQIYRKAKYQYFLLDFCYLANILLLIYIWILPNYPSLFEIAFCCATGPIVMAIPIFGNDFVPHVLDKNISLVLHGLPFLVVYAIRFQHNSQNQLTSTVSAENFNTWSNYLTTFDFCVEPSYEEDIFQIFFATFFRNVTQELLVNMLQRFVLYPMLFYITWGIAHVICIKIIWPLPEDTSYMTVYRYFKYRGKVLMKLPGTHRSSLWRFTWYCILNFASTLSMLLPTVIWYNSHGACLLFMACMFFCALRNGCVFYKKISQQVGNSATASSSSSESEVEKKSDENISDDSQRSLLHAEDVYPIYLQKKTALREKIKAFRCRNKSI